MNFTTPYDHQEQNLTDIFVFRTNIDSSLVFIHLYRELKELPGVFDCSIDLEDCDNVLRIECMNTSAEQIIEIVHRDGFLCEELSYWV